MYAILQCYRNAQVQFAMHISYACKKFTESTPLTCTINTQWLKMMLLALSDWQSYAMPQLGVSLTIVIDDSG